MRVRTLGGFEAYIKLKIENVITQNRLKYNNEKTLPDDVTHEFSFDNE